jgi:hypothetical protein
MVIVRLPGGRAGASELLAAGLAFLAGAGSRLPRRRGVEVLAGPHDLLGAVGKVTPTRWRPAEWRQDPPPACGQAAWVIPRPVDGRMERAGLAGPGGPERAAALAREVKR